LFQNRLHFEDRRITGPKMVFIQGAPPLHGGRAIRSNLLPPPAAKVFPLLSLARSRAGGFPAKFKGRPQDL
jgi:hypothetical protein